MNNFTERRLAHVWIYAIDDMADTHLAVAIAGPLMFIDHKFSLFLASLTLFAVGIFVLTALGVPWYFAWCALWLVPESIFLWKVVTTAWASSELVLENHDLILAVGPCGRLLLDQDIHGEPTVTAIPCEDKYFPRTVFLAKEGPHGATHD